MQIARRVRERGFSPLFLLGPSERDFEAAIREAGFDAGVCLSFRKIAGLFDPDFGTRCVVGNDTGGIHFAAWCGVPALAVAGGGHPGCYYPYPADMPEYVIQPRFVAAECPQAGCRWQCRRCKGGVFPCIADVSAETVAAEVRRLLAEHPIK